jgi:hypothetical protein
MSMPFLTSSGSPGNDRRTATCLMTAFMIAALSPSGAHADDRAPPPSLIERALRRSAYCDPPPQARALTYARFIPELHLRGIVQQSQRPGRASVENIAMAELSWPLERSPALEATAAARDVRERAAARESLVSRIVDAWHQREQALDRADDLTADEADAELDALSGEVDP